MLISKSAFHLETLNAGRALDFRNCTAPGYASQVHHGICDWALQMVTDTGRTCQACTAFWSSRHYLLLCRVLGFDYLPGYLTNPKNQLRRTGCFRQCHKLWRRRCS